MTQRPLRLTASWAHPIDAPPVRSAAVLIGSDGRIATIGSDHAVATPEGAESLDLPGAILLPGFVNTHTHLELTGFAGEKPQPEFPEWIVGIRRRKEARSADEFLEAARQGVRDCRAAGITTIADTGDSGSVIRALSELGGSGVVYQEVFGPHPDQAEASLAGLLARVEELRPHALGRVRLGVSPHAPYTVSGPLFRRTAAFARGEGLPLAVHIAESREETALVRNGTGPFAFAWTARGIPSLDRESQRGPGGRPGYPNSPVQWLDRLGMLGSTTLCIHAVQLLPEDIRLLAERRVAVAHCPLSNARHGHGAAPLAELRRAGIRVGLGTDSVASVGHLDMLAEVRAAATLGNLDDGAALSLATLDGARALGLEHEIGSLTPGKWGDLIAVQHPGDPMGGPGGLLDGRILLTVQAGRVVFRA